jgi:hypothetical protein
MADEWSLEDSLRQLPSPYDTSEGSNNRKIAQMLHAAYWDDLNAAVADARLQGVPKTMTGGTLTQFAKPYVDRRAGESDTSLRIRLAGFLQRQIGPPTPDTIVAFVEQILQATPGQVTIVENHVGGDASAPYEPAAFHIVFSFSLLDALGIHPSAYQDYIDSINESLDFLAAAGVNGIARIGGGGIWDTATWDGGTTNDVWAT